MQGGLQEGPLVPTKGQGSVGEVGMAVTRSGPLALPGIVVPGSVWGNSWEKSDTEVEVPGARGLLGTRGGTHSLSSRPCGLGTAGGFLWAGDAIRPAPVPLATLQPWVWACGGSFRWLHPTTHHLHRPWRSAAHLDSDSRPRVKWGQKLVFLDRWYRLRGRGCRDRPQPTPGQQLQPALTPPSHGILRGGGQGHCPLRAPELAAAAPFAHWSFICYVTMAEGPPDTGPGDIEQGGRPIGTAVTWVAVRLLPGG